MATRANYVKIGLFVVLGFAAMLAVAVGLGATQTRRVTVPFYTYFNESVEGLDAGSPVSFRGVRIGHVGDITIAPDQRLVEVRMDVDVGSMEQLGLVPRGQFKRTHVFPEPPDDLRAQLGTQGLTGNKYVAIDFFDPKTNPLPALTFSPRTHYIPAATSLTKGLEDSVTKAMERITVLVDQATVVVEGVGQLVGDLDRGGAGENAARAIGQADEVLRGLNHIVRSLDREKVGDSVGTTLGAVRVAAGDLDKLLKGLDSDHGLLATTERSVSSFGEVGRNVAGATRDLDATLGEIREAAAAFRQLADELEREPDVLLKGRARGAGP
ncbi:MAG TPA: MlaD family protein [Polyangiaceae bacterium]|nr:MlaD family protein [Polyangiaceae bacterium]